jgi:hypothetical protein
VGSEGVSQTLVGHLVQQLGARVSLGDAVLAAVDTTLIPKVRGTRPGVQQWHDHRGNPARGESLIGQHWALIGWVSAWGTSYLCWPLLARTPRRPRAAMSRSAVWPHNMRPSS